MAPQSDTLIALEKKFWQSMVDQDPDTAIAMLNEPALMVSAHGAMQFDHAGYRRMSEQGPRVLTGFDFRDVQVVFPNADTAILTYRVKQEVASRDGADRRTEEMNDTSTWVRQGDAWRCVMHTETPAQPH